MVSSQLGLTSRGGDRSSYSVTMARVGPPATAGRPLLAELVGGGRRASGEWIAALGVRREKKCGRRLRDDARPNLGRACRNRRGAGQVPSDARGAVRLVVHVMASLAWLFDVRAKPRGHTSLRKRNHCRDEKLHQSE